MPRLTVFACPSCGASLGVEEGAALAQCQFCGNTVIVPEELRGSAPQPQPAAAPSPAAGVYGSLPGLPDMGKMKQMGDAVRAGNKIQAIKIYRELFGVGLAEAKTAVEMMAAGRPVSVNTLSTGTPNLVQMNAQALGSPYATASPPMIVDTRSAQRGGCAAEVIGLIVVLAIAGAALAAVLVAVPDLGQMLSSALGVVTNAYPKAVLSFGGEGTGPGLFTDPRAIAVASDGTIYVAEYTGGVIKEFDPAGKFVKQFKAGAEKNSIIQGLAADRDGNLFVAVDGLVHRLNAETGEDQGALEYADGWGFDDVAAVPGGGLVTSWYKGDDNLVIFDSDLRPSNTVQDAISGVTGDSELDMKVAASGNGDIYALGKFNNAVFHFSPSGAYLNSFGSEGDAAGQFRAAGDIAVDGQGNVCVTDFKGIQVFAPDGRYLSLIKAPSAAYVHGLAFDEAGALYAVTSTKKVIKYQLSAPA
ncbi:MAG: hypothetical protein ABI847_08730, partial [Anaerolineales bacterium]